MAFQKTVSRLLNFGFLATRPMTLGVRVAAFDAQGHVFLVRHTYMPGWYLPGGGVDPGETVEAAARREMTEEGNLEARQALHLVSVHFNTRVSRRDHVVFYRTHDIRQTEPKVADREIAESGFFDPADLPNDATDATRRRLKELEGAIAPDPYW